MFPAGFVGENGARRGCKGREFDADGDDWDEDEAAGVLVLRRRPQAAPPPP